MKRIPFLLSVILLFFIGQSFAQAKLTPLQQKIEAKLLEIKANAEYPGVTVGYVLADGTTGAVSVGLSDLENKTPLKPRDRMLAGSIGKTYVAAVTLQLVQEGKLKLNDKIETWFGKESWFSRLPNANDITLRMLMNHSSGIPEHIMANGFLPAVKAAPDKVWKPEELIAYVLDAKPLFAAGKGYSYADTNYILVGMIFEHVTKKRLYAEVQRRLLKPLKLERTIPSDRRVLPEVIPGYSMPNSPFGFEGRTIRNGQFVFNPQMEWTGGGFASTAEDLARWAKALYEGRVLNPETLQQMLTGIETGQGRGGGAGVKYGLACQIRPSDWGESYGHGGWFPGYLSEMEYFPQKKTAIAVQFNTDARRQIKLGLRTYIAEVAKIILS